MLHIESNTQKHLKVSLTNSLVFTQNCPTLLCAFLSCLSFFKSSQCFSVYLFSQNLMISITFSKFNRYLFCLLINSNKIYLISLISFIFKYPLLLLGKMVLF